jgi:multidrug efflux system membrane fusion protein
VIFPVPRPNRVLRRCSTLALGLLVTVLLLGPGCEQGKNRYVPPPPPKVTVSLPVRQMVTDQIELTGNTAAFNQVELVARVSGYLKAIQFEDGAIVKAGDPLFVIEPEPYEAKVKMAEAALEAAKAKLVRAQLEYGRQVRLVRQNAGAQADLERWQAERDSAEAAVLSAEADLEVAKINYGYTHVSAPFDGLMGKHEQDVGALVGAGGATILSDITQLDPIYAYFNMNERDLARIRRRLAAEIEGGKDREQPLYREVEIPVDLRAEGDASYPHQGRLDFASASLDPGTGTLLLRGVFPNPRERSRPTLLPGMFVEVRIPVGEPHEELLVPERTVGVDQAGPYVLVVGADDIVEQRGVTLGTSVEEMRVITEGLQGDERVVIDGIQRAIPGAKITPVQEGSVAQSPATPKSAPQSAEESGSKVKAE